MAVELAAAPWPGAVVRGGGEGGGVSPTEQPGSAQCWPASGVLWGSGARQTWKEAWDPPARPLSRQNSLQSRANNSQPGKLTWKCFSEQSGALTQNQMP